MTRVLFQVAGDLFTSDYVAHLSDGTSRKWCVDFRDGPGTPACVFYEWGDGTMSLADSMTQEAYQAYLAAMVVT